MGRRGPPKKPLALIEMEGNPGHHGQARLNPNQPRPVVGLPDPPDWLYPEARQEWYRLGEQLVALGVMTTVDYMGFAVLCQAYGRWARAEYDIKHEPEFSPGSRGNITLNPRYQVIRMCVDDIKKMLGQFGLTPASRNEIASAGNDPEEKETWSLFERTRATTQRRKKPDGEDSE